MIFSGPNNPEHTKSGRSRKLGITAKKQAAAEGGYTPEYLELERKKRYGFVYKMEELDAVYRIKLYLPSIIPPSELGRQMGLAGEMPDYTCDISLEDGLLTVKGRLTDEKALQLTGLVNSFPDRFYKEFVFDKPVDSYESSYQDKILEIRVHKS
jgi:hypothetical protein